MVRAFTFRRTAGVKFCIRGVSQTGENNQRLNRLSLLRCSHHRCSSRIQLVTNPLPTIIRSEEKEMKKSINVRVAVGLATIVTTIVALSASGFRVYAEKKAAIPSVIRIAPAAPVFDEKERLAELAQRRSRVAENIGPKSLLILFSTEPRVY